jgi:hypothetical protein
MYISPNYCVEPDAAIISHAHFTHYRCVRSEEAAFSEFGFFAGKRQNRGHGIIFTVKILLFG